MDLDVLRIVAAREAVREIEWAGLVSVVSGSVDVVHPLVRSLIRDRAGAAEQRSVHAELAAALPQGPRRIRHRAFAAQGPDLEPAAAVEHLGLGTPPSVWALTKAADLTPPGLLRSRRYLSAAQAAFDLRETSALAEPCCARSPTTTGMSRWAPTSSGRGSSSSTERRSTVRAACDRWPDVSLAPTRHARWGSS